MNNVSRDAEILRRVRAGETYQSIGDSYGVTKARIGQIATKAGIVGPTPVPLSKSEVDLIIRRAKHGDTYVEIAADMGRCASAVRNAATRSGVASRHASSDVADGLREIALEGRLAGLTAQEISNRTGMTRNAVIGYWFRLKQEGRL
jgi:predicted transcriptional regulator